ncbi:MAG: ABC transporter ATP-binding protein [Acetobacteraceae bacterium]
MAELRIAGLMKSFRGHPVLRGVDLEVPTGELVAILGASGSGKTTLLRLLSGFEHADGGTIEVDGKVLSGPGVHVPPEQRRIGYVAQEGALFPHLSVEGNVLFGLPAAMRRERARTGALLELVGLPAAYASRPPHELSGGEQQRVALARALAPNPRIVLLDEPFSALDAGARVETRETVVAALATAGATALLVTHDQSEALSIGQRVAVLRDGALVQVAAPRTLYRRPVDAELAQFVGEAVLLAGIVSGRQVDCALGRLTLEVALPDGAAEVLVRPEQIRLTPDPDAGAVCARVADVTYYGHDASVTLRLAGREQILVARVSGHQAPRPGEAVGLAVEGAVMAYAPRAAHSCPATPSRKGSGRSKEHIAFYSPSPCGRG